MGYVVVPVPMLLCVLKKSPSAVVVKVAPYLANIPYPIIFDRTICRHTPPHQYGVLTVLIVPLNSQTYHIRSSGVVAFGQNAVPGYKL
jgi:hypothetical protein